MESKFMVGAKVALTRHGSYTTAEIVAKVHKNGNFTLAGRGAQQWRPTYGGVAYETGDDTFRQRVELWTEEAEERIAADERQTQVNKTVRVLLEKLAGRRTGGGDYRLTVEQLAAVKAAVEAIN